MNDIPPINLVWEEPAWPDAIRAPLDEAVRQRLTTAVEVLNVEIASSAPGRSGFDALVGGKRFLSDWAKRGFPQRPPREIVTPLKLLLEQHGLHEAADEISKRYLPELGPGSPGFPSLGLGPRVIIRTPPPPSEVNLATWFAPPVKQLDLARQQLSRYDRWLADQPDLKPALASRFARLTGLTRFMNGRLAARPAELDPKLWMAAANDWLFTPAPAGAADAPPVPAACLLGVDNLGAARQQLQLLDAVIVPGSRIQAPDHGMPSQPTASVHVRFQQKHKGWPVLGGRVIVHMAERDARCSVSSAYLPIPADQFAQYQLRSEAAAIAIALRALAQHALNGQMEEVEAIGLYAAVLDRWLVAGGSDLTGAAWAETIPAIARMLAKHVLHARPAGRLTGALARLEAALAGDPAARIFDARHALHEIQAQLATERFVVWDAGRVVPYLPKLAGDAGPADACFVLPFAGKYYLAYRVEFLAKARDHGWRVFVNADASDTTCDVLGWPESLMAHFVPAFTTSADAAAAVAAALSPASAAHQINANDVDLTFLTLKWHASAPSGSSPLSTADIEQLAQQPVLAPTTLDAGNIAYNASLFYKYFLLLCDNQTFSTRLEVEGRRPPYFTVEVGARAVSGDPLSTGFLASDDAPTIVFQDASRLRAGSHMIGRPAWDPELVFHEIAHALMWLMNSEPFDMASSVTPFARALVEGYANYFARACAVSRAGDIADAAWARACYDAFGDRFNLFDDSRRDPTGNRLTLPNLFPPTPGHDPDANDPLTIGQFQKYSVGMVWARALWKIRERFGADGLDPLLADKLALDSYFYMPGWLANFETAAEGILDGVDAGRMKQLAEWFGARNILAGRGVQALALAGTEVLVGTDAGVRRSATPAIAWGGWETFPAGEGVTGLAHDITSHQTFAATERGVYAWDAAAGWTPHGTWKTSLNQETPLCLAAVGGMVYAGTARGLYALAAATPGEDWLPWAGDSGLAYLVRQVAVAREAGAGGVDEDIAYVATLREARKRRLAVNEPDPGGVQWGDAARADQNLNLQAQMGATTAVAIEAAMGGNRVYIGIFQHGIWRQSTRSNTANWTRITKPGDVEGVVLALHVRPVGGATEVLAGTTAGLFRGTEGNTALDPWAWHEIPFDNDPQAHETITAVLHLSDTVWLVGTANRALWRVAEGAPRIWTQYADIGL